MRILEVNKLTNTPHHIEIAYHYRVTVSDHPQLTHTYRYHITTSNPQCLSVTPMSHNNVDEDMVDNGS